MSVRPAWAGDTHVSDSWSIVPKGIGGTFEDTYGNWTEYNMTDTDVDGRQYIDMWLVPGTQIEFKAIATPAGTRKYEPDFATSSGRRVLIVPSTATTIVMNWGDTPSAPSGLTAYSDTGKAILTWTASTTDQNLDVVNGGGYYVYFDTGPVFDTWVRFALHDTVWTTRTTCTGLTNDSPYYFCVRAFDANLDTGPLVSDYSSSVVITVGSLVDVGFRIYVGEMNDSEVYLGYDTGGGWTERPLTQEGTSNWWSDTVPLNRGYAFTYKYSIRDTGGTKTYEYPVSSGRSHMFLFPHRAGVNSVSVKGGWDWGVANNLTLCADSYWRADVSIGNAGRYEYGFTINGTTWEADTYNTYRSGSNSVLGIDGTPHSSTMRALTVPDTTTIFSCNWEDTPFTPTGLLAMSNPNNTIMVTWTAATHMNDIDSYRLEYSEVPWDSTAWNFLAYPNSDSTTYLHQNIIPTDTYYYRISAVDYSGQASDYKNFATGTATTRREVFFLIRAPEILKSLVGQMLAWIRPQGRGSP